jgi:hypothetical protein
MVLCKEAPLKWTLTLRVNPPLSVDLYSERNTHLVISELAAKSIEVGTHLKFLSGLVDPQWMGVWKHCLCPEDASAQERPCPHDHNDPENPVEW